jgi:C_GCAxxG_C_C family probable redox protein
MASRSETAVELFRSGYSCSESILMAYGASVGLVTDVAQRMGLALAGGMGHIGKTCGAVSAATIVLGLLATKTKPTDSEARMRLLHDVRQLMTGFEERHGTTECKPLIGIDISTAEGITAFNNSGLRDTRCVEAITTVTDVLEQSLAIRDACPCSQLR